MNLIANETVTKLRGGYYTHPDVAAFLCKWILEISPKRILEPSCGDGVFFEVLASRVSAPTKMIGCEINAEEAGKARTRIRSMDGSQVVTADFLAWSLDNLESSEPFDGVVGNPPFVRYQYVDKAQQERAGQIFKRSELPFTKHTNAWVPFVVASLAHLRAGGRLAMIVPSEVLHVPHAEPLRKFLVSQCSRIIIVDPADLWFEKVLQGVVLLFAEKKGTSEQKCKGLAILGTLSKDILEAQPGELFERLEYVAPSELKRKWMVAFLTEAERRLLNDIGVSSNFTTFGKVAQVDVGIVTGANAFFLVSDSTVEKYGLRPWSYPMFGRATHVNGVVFDEDNYSLNRNLGLPTNFLWFGKGDVDSFPPLVQEYIREGEAKGFHRRYKCRIRSPWYNVPSVSSTSLGLLKRCHHFPRLIMNKMNAFTTDTCYRIRPILQSDEQLVIGFVNSATALSAEIEGRHYGGGVLELVPTEIERLIMPRSPEVGGNLIRLDNYVKQGVSPVTILSQQDKTLLKPAGLTDNDLSLLLSAWTRLRTRRQRKKTAS